MTMCVCASKFCFAERFAVFSHCFRKDRTNHSGIWYAALPYANLKRKMRLRNCDLQYVSTVVIPGVYHIFSESNLNDPVCHRLWHPKTYSVSCQSSKPWKGPNVFLNALVVPKPVLFCRLRCLQSIHCECAYKFLYNKGLKQHWAGNRKHQLHNFCLQTGPKKRFQDDGIVA